MNIFAIDLFELTFLKNPFFIVDSLKNILFFFPLCSTLLHDVSGWEIDNNSIRNTFTEIKDHNPISSYILPIVLNALFFLISIKYFIFCIKVIIGINSHFFIISRTVDDHSNYFRICCLRSLSIIPQKTVCKGYFVQNMLFIVVFRK